VSYSRDIRMLDFDFMPGFVEALLRLIAPTRVEGSDFFKRVAGARLRYTPVRLNFSTSYFGQELRAYQYTSILESDSDALIIPIESPRKTLDSDASLRFQPFNSITGDISVRSSRDLLPVERATTQELTRSALDEARNRIAGVDLGWETTRSLTSQLTFKPTVASWLRPSAVMTTRFGTDRNASYLEIITVGADSTAILQRRFQADRELRRQLDFLPYGFWTTMVRDTTGFKGFVGRTLRGVQPITLAWTGALGSQFDRNTTTPALAYQLALGDLERFRFMGIDSAAAATETGRFVTQTSVRLRKTMQLDMEYAKSELQAFDQRGGSRRENEITWPNLRFNWNDVPLPGFLRRPIKVMSFTGSYQYKQRSQALGLSRDSDRGTREMNVPLSARMTLGGGISASYSTTWTNGSSEDPTGDAQHGGLTHSVNLIASFKSPKLFGDKLKEPIRTNLGLTQNEQHQCRFATFGLGDAAPYCIPFLDYRNRTVNLTLDTNVSDLIVGMQLGYTARQDFVGMRRGNSQFQLGIFANFELPVGQMPAGSGMNGIGGGGIR
jgi:hypothetical protein